jgi:hypothetical protein
MATWRVAEAIAAEGLAAPRTFEPCARETDRVLARSADRLAPPVDADETRATFSYAAAFDAIDWSAVVEALPEDVERLARNLTACDAHALDARLGAARASPRSSARRGSPPRSWRRAAAGRCRHCARSRSRPSSAVVPLKPGSSARAR